ncbi:hypothetical protein [Winogradskyella sp.]|uniref:hypothetical protein n=1 Tax=Winogradskyella sp. TaxID=1883156 RepID=UPI00261CA003|nr:hypothetical protein [Winogradskyella sp.]
MKKFFKNIILFLIILLIVGELVVRLTHAVSDIPQRTIDEYGIQKYKPNQKGYWKGGEHTWLINDYGWPGIAPNSLDSLISIIGDSYIENFMNPNECHQSEYLRKMLPDYNFMEFGRSGVSFIEALEISKQMDTLNPKHHLIYVNDDDFYESICEAKRMTDVTQLSLKDNKIKYGEMKGSSSKKVLYNWKLLYYFYNRFPIDYIKNNLTPKKVSPEEPSPNDNVPSNHIDAITKLMIYVTDNYNINDKTLVFHPNSNSSIITIAKNAGFNTILLDSSMDKTWTFDYDSHWTCYGHNKAAEQISQQLSF